MRYLDFDILTFKNLSGEKRFSVSIETLREKKAVIFQTLYSTKVFIINIHLQSYGLNEKQKEFVKRKCNRIRSFKNLEYFVRVSRKLE